MVIIYSGALEKKQNIFNSQHPRNKFVFEERKEKAHFYIDMINGAKRKIGKPRNDHHYNIIMKQD